MFTLRQIRGGIGYLLINFATPIGFYLTFRTYGVKPAIALAIAVTTIQVLVHRLYRLKFSPFFIIASGFIVLFGTMDLLVQNPRFFRLEPFVQNIVMATLLWVTVVARIPVARTFAMALPRWLRPEPSHGTDAYLRKLTWIWVVYLYLKAFLFLYLAFQVDLGTLIVLRSFVGGGSLVLMVLGDFVYRRWWRRG